MDFQPHLRAQQPPLKPLPTLPPTLLRSNGSSPSLQMALPPFVVARAPVSIFRELWPWSATYSRDHSHSPSLQQSRQASPSSSTPSGRSQGTPPSLVLLTHPDAYLVHLSTVSLLGLFPRLSPRDTSDAPDTRSTTSTPSTSPRPSTSGRRTRLWERDLEDLIPILNDSIIWD